MLPESVTGRGRLLAIRLDNMGDVVMLGPALRALRQAFPHAGITLMASPAGSQAAPLLPWVDDVLTERVVWQDISGRFEESPDAQWRLASSLAAAGFEAAFIFTSFSQSPYPPAYLAYLAGIPVRVGQSREFGGGLLTHWVHPPSDGTHQAERNLFLLEAIGLPPAGVDLEIAIRAEEEDASLGLLRSLGIDGRPFVLAAPGASAAARRYDPRRLGRALALMAEQAVLPVLVVGSEREEGLVREVIEAGESHEAGRGTSSLVPLAGRTSVPALAALVRRAELTITMNSGPLHLADALDRPLLVLYSGSDCESMWRPRKAPNRLLRRPTPCSPCFAFVCPYHMECLDIPPEEVAGAALDLLAAGRGGVATQAQPPETGAPLGQEACRREVMDTQPFAPPAPSAATKKGTRWLRSAS